MKTTVGDLIAALSKYDVGTPLVGIVGGDEVTTVFSIQEAHEVAKGDDTLVAVSLHTWPMAKATDDVLGRVEPIGKQLPRIIPMDPIPANANPFNFDLYHMGCEVSGPWMAMYSEHCGHKQDHNKTAEEKASTEPVWNDDPKYIILINQRTGQRFKMLWDQVARPDQSELMQALLLKRAVEEQGA